MRKSRSFFLLAWVSEIGGEIVAGFLSAVADMIDNIRGEEPIHFVGKF